MKINYTGFLFNRKQETDKNKKSRMKNSVVSALLANNIHGHISCKYYADGCVSVSVNGEYYNMYNCNTGKFFSGFVGD